jgi:hypothetical protein
MMLDERQYREGHGPCLAAAAADITVTSSDMTADNRWPDWAVRAVGAMVHRSVSSGLTLHESVRGAFNV